MNAKNAYNLYNLNKLLTAKILSEMTLEELSELKELAIKDNSQDIAEEVNDYLNNINHSSREANSGDTISTAGLNNYINRNLDVSAGTNSEETLYETAGIGESCATTDE